MKTEAFDLGELVRVRNPFEVPSDRGFAVREGVVIEFRGAGPERESYVLVEPDRGQSFGAWIPNAQLERSDGKTTTATRLPDKLSDLLELALGDLEQIEQDRKRYRVDMSVWHTPNSHCSVCLAGSVMARTLGADPREFIDPARYDDDTYGKLGALDDLRRGQIYEAVWSVEGKPPSGVLRLFSVADYKSNRRRWWDDMIALIGYLRSHGL